MIKITRIMLIAILLQITSSLICFGGESHTIKVLKMQAASMQDDTAKIRVFNSLADSYYYNDQLDSCMKYATQSWMLINKLLQTEQVKSNHSYHQKCEVLLALATRLTGLALESKNSSAGLDSLKSALNIITRTGDMDGIGTIHQSLGWMYEYRSQYELALEQYQIAKSIYQETGNKKKLGYLLSLIGICQRYIGNYGNSVESQLQALKIGKEIKDSLTIKEALLALGFTYLRVENWKKALEYQTQALDLLILMKDSSGIARTYSDLGVTHMSMDSLDVAIKNHLASLSVRKKINENYSIASSYYYLGSIYKKQSRYPEALESFKEAYNYSKNTGYIHDIADSHLEIGIVYHKMGYDELAMKNFMETLEFSIEKEDWTGSLNSCEAIADIYLGENKNLQAINWLNKAISYAPANSYYWLISVYKKLSQAYINQGNYKNGYETFVLFDQLKDSMLIAENKDKITKLTNRLEFENKQTLLNDRHEKLMQIKQTEIEKQKLTKNFSLLGMGIILILAIIFFIRFVEKKKLNDKLHLTLSDLKTTQSQLIHAEKMASLGELTAGVAHEIQNPLNFVNNFSEVSVDLIKDMEEEINTGDTEEVKALIEDLKMNLEKITNHGKRASSIVNGMLDHSRKGSGQKEEVDINSMADEYLHLSYHGLRAKDKSFNAGFKTKLDEKLPKISVIPQDIGRVLLNLINNAFYAVNEKKKQLKKAGISGYQPLVVVSTKESNNFIEIWIKDNGNGIPPDIKDKIFQPFFTTKPTGEGTGLGLSLSYDIITKGHGGEIKVETGKEKGSVFSILLPIKL